MDASGLSEPFTFDVSLFMHAISSADHAPRLSVVVPVHNGARWLADTLDAILVQTYADFELILVDDASSDHLKEVLKPYTDPRLQVVHLPKNVGVAGARNHGVALARGEFIGFCDADDICIADRFEQQMCFLEQHASIGACGTAFTCFDTEDRETVTNPCDPMAIRNALMRGNCFGMSTVMGRSSVFRENAFDQNMSPTEDYDMWTRLAAQGVALANLPQSLLRYRVHAQQASQVKSQRLDQLARKIRSRYCAQLLGEATLSLHIEQETVSLKDLDRAQLAIAGFCAANVDVKPVDFRFMLAWIYQRLPDHGLKSWLQWRQVQKRLGLVLDRNYLLNILVLACLPRRVGRSYVDTLTKLKR
jgi:glycosyltransferase involved in cell wall biosynthesis